MGFIDKLLDGLDTVIGEKGVIFQVKKSKDYL